jgi:hypothetical protein
MICKKVKNLSLSYTSESGVQYPKSRAKFVATISSEEWKKSKGEVLQGQIAIFASSHYAFDHIQAKLALSIRQTFELNVCRISSSPSSGIDVLSINGQV